MIQGLGWPTLILNLLGGEGSVAAHSYAKNAHEGGTRTVICGDEFGMFIDAGYEMVTVEGSREILLLLALF